ncbi:hypothetical protein WJX82_000853 [Trebouxia sp. C0006]
MHLGASINRVVTSRKLVRPQCITAAASRPSGVWQANSRVWNRHSRPTSDFNSQSTWLRALQQRSQAANKSSESPQKPVVILIGWLGANKRHFNKYAELWQRMGHKTFGYQPPTNSIVLPPHNMLQPVKGLILDSAPCRLTPSISARGFTAAARSDLASME